MFSLELGMTSYPLLPQANALIYDCYDWQDMLDIAYFNPVLRQK